MYSYKIHLQVLLHLVSIYFSTSLYCQAVLPVKDYSIGNKFVYSLPIKGDTLTEYIVADTLVSSLRYAVVEANFAKASNKYRYFMRSTESEVYLFDTLTRSERLVYRFAQSCPSDFGMGFVFSTKSNNCNFNSSGSTLFRAAYHFPDNPPAGQYYRSVIVDKPYGLTSYREVFCYLMYYPGHTTRPPQYSQSGWSTAFSTTEELILISASAQGKQMERNEDLGMVKLSPISTNTSIQYGKAERIFFRLLSARTSLPINITASNVQSVKLKFTLDTALVQVAKLQTRLGNQADSIVYRNGIAHYYCSFQAANAATDLGYVDVFPKQNCDTSLTIKLSEYNVFPSPKYLLEDSLNLNLRRFDTVEISLVPRTQSFRFQQTERLGIFCFSSRSGASMRSLGIPSMRCKIILDTTLVKLTGIGSVYGNAVDSSRVQGKHRVLYCTFAAGYGDFEVGYIDLASQSIRDSSISLRIEEPILNSHLNFTTTPSVSLALRKLNVTLKINNNQALPPLKYGDERVVVFGLSEKKIPSGYLPISYNLIMDTTGLSGIEFLSMKAAKILTAEAKSLDSGKISYRFILDNAQISDSIFQVRFRSKSLNARQNLLRIRAEASQSSGVEYFSGEQTVSQLGAENLGLSQKTILKLSQNQNLIEHIAPNPAVDYFTVRYVMAEAAEDIQVDFLSSSGILINSFALPKYDFGVHNITFAIKELPNGLYFLRLRSNQNMDIQKIWISR